MMPHSDCRDSRSQIRLEVAAGNLLLASAVGSSGLGNVHHFAGIGRIGCGLGDGLGVD